MTLAVFFVAAAGDHFTTDYIAATPGEARELSPLYNLLKNRLTIHEFVNLSSAIKVVGGLVIFVVAPFVMIVPALLVCTAPTFNMFCLWNRERRHMSSAPEKPNLETQIEPSTGEPL